MKKNNTPHRTYVLSLGKKTSELTRLELNEYTRLRLKEVRERKKHDPVHQIKVWWNSSASHRVEEDKGKVFEEGVGCTMMEFKDHVESLFTEGMDWTNWTCNGWHLDHILAISKGGNNHYTNLRPLSCGDNIRRSRPDNSKTLTCLICSSEFRAWHNAKYCSPACYGVSKRK